MTPAPAAGPAAGGPPPRVALVIPCRNSLPWLPALMSALQRQSYRDHAKVVVDDDSDDGGPDWIARRHPEVELIRLPEHRGFAAAANAGVARLDSELVVLLNADTLPDESWLQRLVERIDASPSRVASVASLMLRMGQPGRVDDAGDALTRYGSARKRGHGEDEVRFREVEEVFSPCAGAALYRRSALLEAGGFDERFGSYWEDVDLGLRLRLLGYGCLLEPKARVLHQGYGSATSRGGYVTLVTCNRMLTLVKGLPASLLRRHLLRLLWAQLYFFLAYRRPLAWLRGVARFVTLLPHAARERRRIQASRRLGDRELEALLEPGLGEPSLGSLVRRRLGATAREGR